MINRTAANCTGCTTWYVTLVLTAVMSVADRGKPEYVQVAIVPLGLLCFLNSHYPVLEQSLRKQHSKFVDKLYAGHVKVSDLCLRIPFYPFSSHLG